MKNKNIIILLVTTSIISSIVTWFISNQRLKNSSTTEHSVTTVEQPVQSNTCSYRIERLKGYKFIHPLVYAEPECEGAKYLPLKSQLENKIADYKSSNHLITASVYFRGFNKGNWINVNPEEKFHPASLLKLPLLITFLKMEEKNPGLLNRSIRFTDKLKTTRIQTFNSQQIQLGKSYTIKELLEYMVSYSDNNATNLLHDLMDVEEHKRTFEYLGLTVPDVYKMGYTISARDYSTFLKVLYNGGYLNYNHAEFAFELLAKTDFRDGLVAGLPKGTLVAHKFGEWTDDNNLHQLHESGIIYMDGKAYLLTIMTSGNNVKNLTEVIAGITKTVYTYLDSMNSSNPTNISNNATHFHLSSNG